MKLARIAIIVIQLVVMLNALGGGYYGLTGAEGVDPAWLEGSPFDSYVVPSLFLFVVIGGGMALASLVWIVHNRHAALLSLAMGLILIAWIVVQVAIIGYVSWLQPASFVAGIAIALLAWRFLRLQRAQQVA
jgi:energy-converting hydrogenase Eha subunit B